jgi:hypothetical protein
MKDHNRCGGSDTVGFRGKGTADSTSIGTYFLSGSERLLCRISNEILEVNNRQKSGLEQKKSDYDLFSRTKR